MQSTPGGPILQTKDVADTPRVGRKVRTFADGSQEATEGDTVDRNSGKTIAPVPPMQSSLERPIVHGLNRN